MAFKDQFKVCYENAESFQLFSNLWSVDPDEEFSVAEEGKQVKHVKLFTISWSGGCKNHAFIVSKAHHLNGFDEEDQMQIIGGWIDQAVQPLHGFGDDETVVFWDYDCQKDEMMNASFETKKEAIEFLDSLIA